MDFQNADPAIQWDSYSRMLTHFLSTTENNLKIENMIGNNQSRFPVNLDELRKLDSNLCQSIIQTPTKAIKIIENALKAAIDERLGGSEKKRLMTQKETRYRVAFEGNLGRNLVTPRGLSSALVHNLVGVQGIVTRVSLVRPKLVKSVHHCEKTQKMTGKEYNDDYELGAEKNYGLTNAFPLKDQEGNPLTCDFGSCVFKDFQNLVIQEMPECAPTGLLPRSVEVVLEDDLADKVKPGDRVQVIGVYKAVANHTTSQNGYFKVVLVATSISALSTELNVPNISGEDIKNMRKMAERADIFDLLSKSIAPSIQGHEFIKKGILLMLLGGVEKTLENNTHLRGDINILIIGDPSTAKSQMLRHILNIAPLAINTTGRGSSGVGLTAAVAFEKETGEKHLEAGAMVLADRGIVCIDEFDKMSEVDRVAIHEVMEQQTVTIAKAGIHTSLNARCSVIAAANPIYGEYQKDLPPTKNIGLPDSLLSRFDLLYVVLDEKSSMHDRKVAERVTKNHRYMAPNQSGESMGLGNMNEDNYVIEPEHIDDKNVKVFEKFNHVLHSTNQKELVSQGFLKKYIYYAKKSYSPVLEDNSIEYIADAWNKLRQKDMDTSNTSGVKNLSITIRTLETLIRLASAHAKLRLSKKVEKTDCFVALNLLKYALFNELMDPEEELNFQTKINEEDQMINETEKPSNYKGGYSLRGNITPKKKEEDFYEKEIQKLSISGKKQKKDEGSGSKQLKREMKEIHLDENEDIIKIIEENVLASVEVQESQIKYVFRILSGFFSEKKKTQITVDELWKYISEKKEAEIQNKEQMLKCLAELDDNNKIMLNRLDNKVYSLH